MEAILKEGLTLQEFSHLIRHDENDELFFEALAKKAQEITKKRFGSVKGFYIPLYLSSSCHNSCTYCGFSVENHIKRKTLSMDEIKNELKTIYAKGFRNILLVSGELQGFKNIAYLASAVSLARDVGFHSICIEFGALDEQQASQLVKAGSQSFVLYQETYNKKRYEEVHIGGLKTDYDYRIAGAERAISAGFKQITLGFLVGLCDPLLEAVALYKHLSRLKKKYWEIEFSISFPRITKAEGNKSDYIHVGDRKFAQIMMAFRLAFPEVAINLSTREEKSFRDGMANICVTHLSAESKTTPGGYENQNSELLEQFEVHDNRNLDEMIKTLEGMGYDVHLKDWEAELNRV